VTLPAIKYLMHAYIFSELDQSMRRLDLPSCCLIHAKWAPRAYSARLVVCMFVLASIMPNIVPASCGNLPRTGLADAGRRAPTVQLRGAQFLLHAPLLCDNNRHSLLRLWCLGLRGGASTHGLSASTSMEESDSSDDLISLHSSDDVVQSGWSKSINQYHVPIRNR